MCGINKGYCYQCENPLVSLNGKCVNHCPDKYYLSNQQCLRCDPECETCQNYPNQCTSCTGNPFQQAYLDAKTNNCIEKCTTTSYFNDIDPYLCDVCLPQCKTCSYTSDNCTSCGYDQQTQKDLFLYEGNCISQCPTGFIGNLTSHKCETDAFKFDSFPHIFLISAAGLTFTALGVSHYISAGSNLLTDLFIVGFSNIEFLNRVFLLANLWMSTKTFSFCVTGLTITLNALLGVYFTTFILQPLTTQISSGIASSILFKGCAILTQISGVNSIRLLTSNFFGIKALSNKFLSLPYYQTQLEGLSLISTVLSLFQLSTGMACLFDFAKGKDAFGFGINCLAVNVILIGLKGYKFYKAQMLFKQYQNILPQRV